MTILQPLYVTLHQGKVIWDLDRTSFVNTFHDQVVTMTGVYILSEHHDFSFACCWSPDGRLFATGNQDKTTRIYDIRQPTEAIHVLGANVGAIRSLQFTHDGQYLIAAGMHVLS